MNANDLFKAVTELNLDPIKMKLMHVESGEGWSLEKANAVEKEYRRFLCLMKLFPEEDTAPLVDVDTFWHYHILDTMKYAADCERVFGYFLHHYPYVGLGGSEEDEQFRLASGERMRTLYESLFGEAYPGSLEQAPAVLAATAYCASPLPPHKPVQAPAGTAYCASPLPPHKSAQLAAATAYCASPLPPHKPAQATVGTAYCASPLPPHKPVRASVNTAYCASPLPPHKPMRASGNTAYCASPLPPHKPMRASGNTAYCASPLPPHKAARASGNTAYCASPLPPHKAGQPAGLALVA